MARYKNGQIPPSMLVRVGTATQVTTAATAQRWRNFVADAQRTFGWTPRITLGENAYRDYDTQVKTRAWACGQGDCGLAAWPGTSSHGGEFNGRDAMAYDVANWQEVGWEKFKLLAERNGFTVGYFSNEPWHIIDYNPYTMPEGADDMTPEEHNMLKFLVDAIKVPGQEFGYPEQILKDVRFLHDPVRDIQSRVRGSDKDPDYADGDMLQRIRGDIWRKSFTLDPSVVKAIADAVVAQIGKPTVTIDYDKIAAVVRDKFATQPLK